MSQNGDLSEAFDKLIRDLDDHALRDLQEAAAREAGVRRQQTSVQMEDIHPNMAAAEKQRVRQEIARVLRGEEQ